MHPKMTRRIMARVIAKAFDAEFDALCGPSRSDRHCKVRYAIWFLVRDLMPTPSLSSLGDLVGGKDHSTVLHGLARATHFLVTDEHFRTRVERARKAISAWRPEPPVMVVLKPALPPEPIRAERPPERKSEPPRPKPSVTREDPYAVWQRTTCKESEDRFLSIAMREFPHLVRVPQKEAAE